MYLATIPASFVQKYEKPCRHRADGWSVADRGAITRTSCKFYADVKFLKTFRVSLSKLIKRHFRVSVVDSTLLRIWLISIFIFTRKTYTKNSMYRKSVENSTLRVLSVVETSNMVVVNFD